MNEKSFAEGARLGEFFVSKRNGEACFDLMVDVPPGIRGVQPSLSVSYRSLTQQRNDFIGNGWFLDGLPELIRRGQSKFYQDGQEVTNIESRSDTFRQFDLEGGTRTYAAGKNDNIALLRTVSDIYGNEMSFEYDQQDRPKKILYGCNERQNRAVLFSYDNDRGLLTEIETQVADNSVSLYQLSFANNRLCQIQVSARDSKEDLKTAFRRPVQFDYESVAGTNLLSIITEISGLKYELAYLDETRALESYCAKVKGPFHKETLYEYLVHSSNLIRPLGGVPFCENLALWDCAQKMGSFWRYGTAGIENGSLLCEGSFGQIVENCEVFSETLSAIFFSHDISPFHKISETEYDYIQHDISKKVLKSSGIYTGYVSHQKALPSILESFEYDVDGLLVQQRGPKTTAIREYVVAKGPGRSKLLKRSALYDVSGAHTDRLIKDDHFEYEFDLLTGRPIKLTHQTLIDDEIYSFPTISELTSKGLPSRVTGADGMVTESRYDAYDFCTAEIMRSEDGCQSETQYMKREPAFGNLVYTKSVEGAICRQYQNAFGELTSVSGFDPSDPESWLDDDGIVPLFYTETRLDPDFGCQVTIQSQKHDKMETFLQKKTVLDSLNRPVIQLDEMDHGKWSIQFIKHGSEHRAMSQSVPMEIRASRKNLASVVRKIKKNKTHWFRQLHDSFGRECGTVFPDGSTERITYEMSSHDELVTTRTATSPAGKKGAISIELSDGEGQVSSVRRGDEKPTFYCYDVEGHLVRKIDPLGQETEYSWNALGRCIHEKNAVTGDQSARYSRTLRLEGEVRNDTHVGYRYDWRGRPAEKTVKSGSGPSKSHHLHYFSDPENRSYSVRATHPDGWGCHIRVTPSGQEIERTVELGPNYCETITTDLYSSGKIHVRHYPDGRSLEYGYHASGWTRSLNWLGEKNALVQLEGQDSFGRPSEIQYSNGITERRSFSTHGNMTKFSVEKRHHNSTKNLLTQEFGYLSGYMGLVENIVQQDSQNIADTSRFLYDHCGRLSSVTDNQGKIQEQFRYDASGSIQQFDQAGQTYQKYIDENHNQKIVEKVDNSFHATLCHDRSGYVTSAKQSQTDWNFFFGEEGDLELIQRNGNDGELSVQVTTDATGQRLMRSDSNGTITIFVAEDYQLTRTMDGKVLSTIKMITENGCLGESTKLLDAEWGKEHLFGGTDRHRTTSAEQKTTSLISEQRKPGTVFLHLDYRGSTLMATDLNGNSIAQLSFDSYGNINTATSTGCCEFDVVFAGMILDPLTGLYYAKERYYSSEFMGFLSPDPARSSTDSYGYPNDPINSFDYNGACRMENFCRNFMANYGRETTVFGSGVFTALTSLALFMFWDLAVFGYPVDEAVRWSLAIAFWFVQLVVFPGIFGSCNENRRIKCCRERRQPVGDGEIGKLGRDAVRVLIGTTIGVVWMGPLISFIGTDECEGWEMFNCSFDFYRMNFIRGAVTCGFSSIMGVLVGRALDKCAVTSNTLIMKYLTGVGARVIGSVSWQGSDFALLHFAYGRPARETFEGKIPFFVGMVSMSVFMAQPNLIWGLLPAVFNGSCLHRFWSYLFKPRSVFATSHPRAGEIIPFFYGGQENESSEGSSSEGIRISVGTDSFIPRISMTESDAFPRPSMQMIGMEESPIDIDVIEEEAEVSDRNGSTTDSISEEVKTNSEKPSD